MPGGGGDRDRGGHGGKRKDKGGGDGSNSAPVVPRAVLDFVFDLHEASRRAMRVGEVHVLYTSTFAELTEEYFSSSAAGGGSAYGGRWPRTDAVAAECADDEEFLLLYRELTTRNPVTVRQYLDSWETYSAIFDWLLRTDTPDTVISQQWAWDILKEFVYVFQSVCQRKHNFSFQVGDGPDGGNGGRGGGSGGKRKGGQHELSAADMALLADNPECWSVRAVNRYLNGLIRKSRVTEYLETKRAAVAGLTDAEPDDVPPSQMHLFLGYFALISKARLECLLGDYDSAIAALGPIHVFDRSELFHSVLACHVDVFYHLGYSYLMMRRHADAARVLSALVLHLMTLANSPQGDSMYKTTNRVLSLLAICMAVCPTLVIDRAVKDKVMDRVGHKHHQLIGGNTHALRDLNDFAGPKAVNTSLPDYEAIRAEAAAAQEQAKAKAAAEEEAKKADGAAEDSSNSSSIRSNSGRNFGNDPRDRERDSRRTIVVTSNVSKTLADVLVMDVRPLLDFAPLRAHMQVYSVVDLNNLSKALRPDHYPGSSDGEESEEHRVQRLQAQLIAYNSKLTQLDNGGFGPAFEGAEAGFHDMKCSVDGDVVRVSASNEVARAAAFFAESLQSSRQTRDEVDMTLAIVGLA